jgi:hypothetical protein
MKEDTMQFLENVLAASRMTSPSRHPEVEFTFETNTGKPLFRFNTIAGKPLFLAEDLHGKTYGEMAEAIHQKLRNMGRVPGISSDYPLKPSEVFHTEA